MDLILARAALIRYLARSEKPVEDGHLLADFEGRRFQVGGQNSDNSLADRVTHKPFGRLMQESKNGFAFTHFRKAIQFKARPRDVSNVLTV